MHGYMDRDEKAGQGMLKEDQNWRDDAYDDDSERTDIMPAWDFALELVEITLRKKLHPTYEPSEFSQGSCYAYRVRDKRGLRAFSHKNMYSIFEHAMGTGTASLLPSDSGGAAGGPLGGLIGHFGREGCGKRCNHHSHARKHCMLSSNIFSHL